MISDCNGANFEIEDGPDSKGYELNHLSWLLGQSKETSWLFASRLNKKNMLKNGAKVSYFRSLESGLLHYFRSVSTLVYKHNIQGLLKELGIIIYNSNEWWLFI